MDFILVFSSFYFFAYVEGGCPGGTNACDWIQWGEWGNCSKTCGGGSQYRNRELCCRNEDIAKGIDACYSHCGLSSSGHDDYRACNTVCNNGGTIHYAYSKYGDCKCPLTHSGTCCDIRMCAWNDNFCWPGHCFRGRVSGCDCISGFRVVATSKETKCQPTWSPSILKCKVNATGHNGEYEQADKNGNVQCPYWYNAVTYVNFQPASLQYDLLSVYSVDVESYPKPDFISEFKFGVTDILISVTKYSVSGTRTIIGSQNPLEDSSSSQNANETVFDNGSLSTLNYTISNGESVCLKIEVRGGGYLKSKNTETNSVSSAIPYNKVSTIKEICFRYDNDPPIHCQASGTCNIEPLQLQHRISRSSEHLIKFAGWEDPVPSGGSKVHASSIENYKVIVNQVMTSRGQPSKIDVELFSKLVNYTDTNMAAVNLTDDNPTLYCITLEVKDKADNVRKARRFILVDNTSYIITKADKPFLVTTASSQTNYTWQTNHQHVCLDWTDHFINEFYVENEVLNPVEPDQDGHFTGVYEQLSGELPVTGTPNVNGIIEFVFSWKVNDGNFSGEISVPNFLNQSYCTNLSVEDGQTYTFKIRSIDIANNTFEEERTVYIDRSAPYISNISLMEDTNMTLDVYHRTDLSTNQLYFETTDLHSGIRSITWTFNETDSGLEVASGSLEVGTISAKSCSESTDRCFCPDVGPCELFNYTFPLNKLAIYHKQMGVRNTSYYFTVTVTNNALLSSTEHKEIMVNNYQPEPGKVHIGKVSYVVGGTAGCLVFIASLAIATVLTVRKKRLVKHSNSKSTSYNYEDKSSGHATDIKGENVCLEPVCYDNPEYNSPGTKLSEKNPCQHKNTALLSDESQETENVYELMEDFDSKWVTKENCRMKAATENRGSNKVCKPTASLHSRGNTDDCGETYENLNNFNVSSG